MKDEDFTPSAVFAVTIDQRRSTTRADRVPALLERLTRLPDLLLLPERTAGDEVQLLLAGPEAVAELVEAVTRQGEWWVGIGIGDVDTPLPSSTRAARGSAYLAARSAVDRSHQSPTGLALDVLPARAVRRTVTGGPYGELMSTSTEVTTLARHAEAALWLQQSLLARRSAQGWEVTDLLDAGASVADVAARLGISASAVSQRHARAGREHGLRGRELCATLLGQLQRAVAA